MYIREKKLADDFLDLLSKAHYEIRRALERDRRAEALSLLEQCQEGAVELGTLIEGTEGEGFVTVGLLEEYCELVYQVYTAVGQGGAADAAQVYSRLKKGLAQIAYSVKHDIVPRLKIVFLPYKAAMWDSMESVWRAAAADPGCRVDVVPIPYYERNEDGSMKTLCYEGAEFPGEVPVVHYSRYDLERERPDIIYIHNPYDDQNCITSVAPQFYSTQLKKWTERLVYIPYFVSGNPKKEEAEPEKLAHLILTEGVFNADRVIVQSEVIKYCYEEVLARHFGDTEENRRMLDRKILALGSPKFDRILEAQRRGVEIPEAWRDKILDPEGNRRKVVFYNTGIGMMLESDERWIQKMEDVFSVFRERREETALLWRPHPLMEPALDSMRPGLLEEYLAIKERFLAEDWGIYDDSTDVDRAVVLSDVFYGDRSSVARLFGFVKKPFKVHQIEADAQSEYQTLKKLLKRKYVFPAEQPLIGERIHKTIAEELRRSCGRGGKRGSEGRETVWT